MYLFIRSDTVFYTARGAIYIHSHTVSIMLRIVAEAIFFGNLATKKGNKNKIISNRLSAPSSPINGGMALVYTFEFRVRRKMTIHSISIAPCSLSISRGLINWPPFVLSFLSFSLFFRFVYVSGSKTRCSIGHVFGMFVSKFFQSLHYSRFHCIICMFACN